MIFCRNVLIYFDDATKRAVLGRLAVRLASDGYLVLGAAETTTSHSPDFMAVPEHHHGVFCFTPAAAAAARARDESDRRKAGGGANGGEREPSSSPSEAGGPRARALRCDGRACAWSSSTARSPSCSRSPRVARDQSHRAACRVCRRAEPRPAGLAGQGGEAPRRLAGHDRASSMPWPARSGHRRLW